MQETPLETFRTDIAAHALWDIPIYRRYGTEASMYTTIDHPTTVYRLILSTGIIADVRSTLCLEPPDGLPRFRFYPPATWPVAILYSFNKYKVNPILFTTAALCESLLRDAVSVVRTSEYLPST